MRAALTTTEALLWQELRGCRLGVCFRRQVPVGARYIADFCAPSIALIVEVDGGYHRLRSRADARRDKHLTNLGYTILRLPADLVLHQLGAAVGLVRAAVLAARS